MKRSLILCSLLSLLALSGVAHADPVPSCTAKLIKPDKDGQNVTGTTDVTMASQHTFTVTGGASNGTFFVKWDCSVGFDGAGLAGTNDGGTNGSLQHFNVDGLWRAPTNLPANNQPPPDPFTIYLTHTTNIPNGSHLFEAKSNISINQGSNQPAYDSKTIIVGPLSTTGNPGGGHP